jgi:hypothetical protein
MLRLSGIFLLALLILPAADDLVKPDKISIHTWVREDLFAGWMANDSAPFERGVRKLDRFLQDHPEDANALAWKYLETMHRMRRAHAANDNAAYQRHLAAGAELAAQSLARARGNNSGPYIIVGSVMITAAYAAPEDQRAAMYREGREILRKVPVIQGASFDKLPAHMRGELWSLMTVASDLLGDKGDRDQLIQDMIAKLPGSVYESRAVRWQKLPDLSSQRQYMCLSCHEPGRLNAVVARLNGPEKK